MSEASTQNESIPLDIETLFDKARIPRIVVAADGSILAFAKCGTLFRRRVDGGKIWSEPEPLDGAGGNAMIDENTGHALFVCPRENYLLRSKDHGKSWKKEAIVLKVKVTGAGAAPAFPSDVVFTITDPVGSGAELSNSTSTETVAVDSSGFAETTLTLGSVVGVGAYTVTATVDGYAGLGTITFTATATTPGVDHFSIQPIIGAQKVPPQPPSTRHRRASVRSRWSPWGIRAMRPTFMRATLQAEARLPTSTKSASTR